MKSITAFIIIATGLITFFANAQTGNPVIYKLQIRGADFNESLLENQIPTCLSYSYVDSSALTRLAEDYLKMIFRSPENELSTFYTNEMTSESDGKLYPIISKGGSGINVPKEKVTVSDTLLYIDGAEYISKSGKMGFNYDTIYVEDITTGEQVQMVNFSFDVDIMKELSGFRFYEKWDYDNTKNEFIKTVDAIAPFVTYKRNNYYDEEAGLQNRMISVYNTKNKKEAGDLLFKDMVYDVMVIPESYYQDMESYDYGFGYPTPDFCSNLVIDLIAGVKSGKVKAFAIGPDPAKNIFNVPLDYESVTDSLAFSIKTVIRADTAKLRSNEMYRLEPVIEKKVEFKMNEYGEYTYDENYNPIILSETDVILGYDTIWPSPGKYRRELLDITTDTIVVYRFDPETGDYIYDENGNMIIDNTTLSVDTVWKETLIGLNEFEFFAKDTVWHNHIEDIHSIRFYEDWYMDRETFTLKKKINGIAFNTGLWYFNSMKMENELFTTCKVYFKFNQ